MPGGVMSGYPWFRTPWGVAIKNYSSTRTAEVAVRLQSHKCLLQVLHAQACWGWGWGRGRGDKKLQRRNYRGGKMEGSERTANRGDIWQCELPITISPAPLTSFKFDLSDLIKFRDHTTALEGWKAWRVIKHCQTRYWVEIQTKKGRRINIAKESLMALFPSNSCHCNSAIMTSVQLINTVIDIWPIADAIAITMIIQMTVISQHFGTYGLGCYCFNGS